MPKKLKQKNPIFINRVCVIEDIKKDTGSFVYKATLGISKTSKEVILCTEDFKEDLTKAKNSGNLCKIVYRVYKKHSPYLVSIEVGSNENT